MSEVRHIPRLRFSEFVDSLDKIKFGSIVRKSIYGPRFNADDYDANGNVKTIRGTDVSLDGEIKYSQTPIASLDERTVKTHRLVDGDLVMITTADCGLTGIFRKQDYDYISSAYAVKIGLKNEVEPYFFKYFFQTDLSKREVKKYIRKATVSNLPCSDILRIKLSLPTKPEQQKIAAFLTAVDNKIEQLSKKQGLLSEYKKGVMQKIFSQTIRFKADDDSDFSDWKEKKLGSVTSIVMGQSPDSTSYNFNGAGLYLIQGNADIKKRKTSPRVWTDTPTKECKVGDIIMTVRAPVGAVAKSVHNACIGRGVCAIRNNQHSISNYIYQFLLDFEDKWIKFEQGSTFTAVNTKDVKSLKLILPTIQEQTKIANFLSSIDNKTEQIGKQLDNSKQFKKALLQQMFV